MTPIVDEAASALWPTGWTIEEMDDYAAERDEEEFNSDADLASLEAAMSGMEDCVPETEDMEFTLPEQPSEAPDALNDLCARFIESLGELSPIQLVSAHSRIESELQRRERALSELQRQVRGALGIVKDRPEAAPARKTRKDKGHPRVPKVTVQEAGAK